VPRLHLTIDASLDTVPAAGGAVRDLCLTSGIDAGDAALVELAIVEALQNTIEHGYAGAPGRLELDAEVDEQRIQAEIRDTAPLVDLTRIASSVTDEELPLDRASLQERGRGLGIIRAVFDEVVFSHSATGNHLALTRARQRGPA
jgi:anti-sigma regulatory factor (Ser/Thr protein kinase)